jgi:hypothetical protein
MARRVAGDDVEMTTMLAQHERAGAGREQNLDAARADAVAGSRADEIVDGVWDVGVSRGEPGVSALPEVFADRQADAQRRLPGIATREFDHARRVTRLEVPVLIKDVVRRQQALVVPREAIAVTEHHE